MTEIEKMKRYIERTKMDEKDPGQYAMDLRMAFELANHAQGTKFALEAINLAFKYGRAKGYRAAKAERRARA